MESSSTSANSSFGSTASSTSPSSPSQAPHRGDTATDDQRAVAIKQEPVSEVVDAYGSEWAHIFDENGVMCLDDDDPMDAADVAADPRRAADAGASAGTTSDNGARGADALYRHTDHEPTPSSALLDNWGYYDTDMLSPATQPDDAPIMGLPLWHTVATFFDPALGPKTEMTRAVEDRAVGVVAAPMCTVVFEKQARGQPFPLSKPLVRDDGVLVVGTELPPSAVGTDPANRIFITRFGQSQEAHVPYVVKAHADVRDLEWLSPSAAVAAIGNDIHLLLLDANANECATLTTPVRRMHADTIRELAVLYAGRDRPIMIASGGFDETVVLTKLGEGGDPATAKMDTKIDAYDVVSSLRWHPTETGTLSWTTDGGDFQIIDARARAKPQLQVALSSLLEIDRFGGLYCHEYISPSNVVLGFQSGRMLFLDLRVQRKECCYGGMDAPLACVGEMRRSATGMCAMFGLGGFATATVNPLGRELASLVGARPPHSSQVGVHDYKTSGDFSHGSSSFLAVSDCLGVISVYGTDCSNVKPSTTVPPATALDRDWQEHSI